MDKPLVSIITPCFNMAHCIFRLFDSILIQNYNSLEFILIDDGSTDKIDLIVKKYALLFEQKNIRFIFFRQENKGLAGAINTGLQLMSGDFFIWPDADDYLEPDSILKRVEILLKKPECGVVSGQAYLRNCNELDSYVSVLKESNTDTDIVIQFERMLNGDALFCSGCHMIRTSYFNKVNPLNSIYTAKRGQNWQLLLPLYFSYPRAFIDIPVYNYLDFPNSMSSEDETIEKKINRYKEHFTIISETLSMIEKVQAKDLQLYYLYIQDKYTKLQMEAAVTFNNISFFENIYAQKKQGPGIDILDRIAYFQIKNTFFKEPLKLCYKILRKLYRLSITKKKIVHIPEIVAFIKLSNISVNQKMNNNFLEK